MNEGVDCGVKKPGWYCSRPEGHDGPCAAWPVSHATAERFYEGRVGSRRRRFALAVALLPWLLLAAAWLREAML